MGFDGTVNSILGMRTKGTPEPELGMGVTFLSPGDRTPGTIVEIVLFKSGPGAGQARLLRVRHDDWEIISGNGGDGSAKYKITPATEGPLVEITRRTADSPWKCHGRPVAVGRRDVYQDPHF
jgi:hypothetical protein